MSAAHSLPGVAIERLDPCVDALVGAAADTFGLRGAFAACGGRGGRRLVGGMTFRASEPDASRGGRLGTGPSSPRRTAGLRDEGPRGPEDGIAAGGVLPREWLLRCDRGDRRSVQSVRRSGTAPTVAHRCDGRCPKPRTDTAFARDGTYPCAGPWPDPRGSDRWAAGTRPGHVIERAAFVGCAQRVPRDLRIASDQAFSLPAQEIAVANGGAAALFARADSVRRDVTINPCWFRAVVHRRLAARHRVFCDEAHVKDHGRAYSCEAGIAGAPPTATRSRCSSVAGERVLDCAAIEEGRPWSTVSERSAPGTRRRLRGGAHSAKRPGARLPTSAP